MIETIWNTNISYRKSDDFTLEARSEIGKRRHQDMVVLFIYDAVFALKCSIGKQYLDWFFPFAEFAKFECGKFNLNTPIAKFSKKLWTLAFTNKIAQM